MFSHQPNSFAKGDCIDIVRRVDDEWLEGRLDERTGIFPVAFVAFNDGEASLLGFEVVASFDYVGEQEDELTFKQGDVITVKEAVDADWFQGSLDGKEGIFPSAFVAWASALYDYEGTETDELSFVQGERINLAARVDEGKSRVQCLPIVHHTIFAVYAGRGSFHCRENPVILFVTPPPPVPPHSGRMAPWDDLQWTIWYVSLQFRPD